MPIFSNSKGKETAISNSNHGTSGKSSKPKATNPPLVLAPSKLGSTITKSPSKGGPYYSPSKSPNKTENKVDNNSKSSKSIFQRIFGNSKDEKSAVVADPTVFTKPKKKKKKNGHKHKHKKGKNHKLSKQPSFSETEQDTEGTIDEEQIQQEVAYADIMSWIVSGQCPTDVVPKILAFAGPRHASALGQTHEFWHAVMNKETTWKILSEELYKWKPGDPEPRSWKEYYFLNPCVPVDFRSIHKAISWATETVMNIEQERHDESDKKEDRTMKRYARMCDDTTSGHYNDDTTSADNETEANDDDDDDILGNRSRSSSTGDYTSRSTSHVDDLALLEMDDAAFQRHMQQKKYEERVKKEADRKMRTERTHHYPQRYSVRVLLRPGKHYLSHAVTVHSLYPDVTLTVETMEMPVFGSYQTTDSENPITTTDSTNNLEGMGDMDINDDDSEPLDLDDEEDCSKVAMLVSRTRRRNEPLFRLVQGQLNLRNLKMKHDCRGVDIWDGNAAIHIYTEPHHDPRNILSTSLNMDTVEITSDSGRGIVAVNSAAPAQMDIKNCYIHSCAATGIYLAGHALNFNIANSDVTHNGIGYGQNHVFRANQQRGGVMASGHSGIYMEEGCQYVNIQNCNISRNTTSGICMLSFAAFAQQHREEGENGEASEERFSLSDSDILMNGVEQMQVANQPQGGQMLFYNFHRNNQISLLGTPKARSTILKEKEALIGKDDLLLDEEFQQEILAVTANHAVGPTPIVPQARLIMTGEAGDNYQF